MIMKDLSGSDAKSFKRNDVSFSPLTYNGEVTKLTWPLVTDIKNPNYTSCRYIWPYETLKVYRVSRNWLALGVRCVFIRHHRSDKIIFSGPVPGAMSRDGWSCDPTWWPDLAPRGAADVINREVLRARRRHVSHGQGVCFDDTLSHFQLGQLRNDPGTGS